MAGIKIGILHILEVNMKVQKIFLASIILMMALISMPTSGQTQLKNKLPKKAIIDATQQALQDTTSIHAILVGANNIISITIEGNTSEDNTTQYVLTLDSLGITLEVLYANNIIYNEFFKYSAANFNKVIAYAEAMKLKSSELHRDTIASEQITTINFNLSSKKSLSLHNKLGMADYEGNFSGFVTYAQSLVPDFNSIINAEYLNPTDFIDDAVYINGFKTHEAQTKESKKVITVPIDTCLIIPKDVTEKIVYQLEISEDEAKLLKLIKVEKNKNKNKNVRFTYKDVTKNSIPYTAINLDNNGIATIEYDTTPLNKGVYCIYNPSKSKALIFYITDSLPNIKIPEYWEDVNEDFIY